MVRICAMGGASQDVFVSGKGIETKFDPKTNEYFEELKLGAKLNIEKLDFATGGGATNASVTFARQGLDSSFIGKLGKDIAAQSVVEALDKEHVDTGLVVHDDSDGTQYSTILLTESGERTILVYRGVSDKHRPQDYRDVDFSQFDWLYVSSFGGAFDALDDIFRRAHEQGVKIAFNPGSKELAAPDKLKALFEDVEILIINKEEAQMLIDGTNIEELARRLTTYLPVVIVSDGPNGVVATDSKTVVRAGMYEDVPVIDRTGAGDAFGSGFLSQWAQGRSLKDSIVFASANSTSVVTKIGAKEGILHKGVDLHAMPLKESDF